MPLNVRFVEPTNKKVSELQLILLNTISEVSLTVMYELEAGCSQLSLSL